MWEIIERPGYFGLKRNELYDKWNNEFGISNWKISWVWGSQIIEKPEAIQLYEDAYYEYLKQNPDVLDWLISTSSDVYDTAPSNIYSKFDYNIQETPRNHLHDIAIRRSVLRLGVWFKGEELIQVRNPGTKGERLNPHFIPFHKPEMISKEEIKDYCGKGYWWRNLGIKNSIEEFYQSNKLLLIKK